MVVNLFLLITMVVSALWTVLAKSLLKSMIALALTSAVISILMFRLNAAMAGVFELSVCAGLITAIFASAISLIKPLPYQETKVLSRKRMKKYWPLPVLTILIGSAAFFFLKQPANLEMPLETSPFDVKYILWNIRHMEILGQIIIIILGAVGVFVLFKESQKK